MHYLQEPQIIQRDHLKFPVGSDYTELIIDKDGHYHLYAQNNSDLYKVLGYLQAAEYLEKMDLFLRAANGTLSEAFGSEFVELDVFSRTIGFANIAAGFINQVDPVVNQVLTAYCDGINAYIDDYTHQLPRPFKLKRYLPSRWRPQDCLAIQRLLAWSLSDQVNKKVVIYKLLEIYGVEKVRDGFPAFHNLPPDGFESYDTQLFSDLNRFVNTHLKLIKHLGFSPEELENSWTLAANHSENGVPALGGELPFFLKDYHDLVELNSPSLHVSGLVLPGIPFVLFGCNGQIAWNLTVRPADNLEYLLPPQNSPISTQTRRETIAIRNSEDSTITITETPLGPVINHYSGASPYQKIIVQWGGYLFSDDLKSYTGLYSATNWEDFKLSVSQHVVPAAEVDFIDRNNNIGTAQYISDLEINHNIERLPSLSRIYEPDYIRPIHHLFRYLNPQTGIIRHHRALSGFLPDSIISGDILLTDTAHKFSDILNMRTDRHAQMLLSLIFGVISEDDLHDPRYRKIYSVLKSWNFDKSVPGPQLTIYDTFINTLAESIYRDEMDLADSRSYSQFSHLTDEVYLNLIALLNDGESSWFDDIRSAETVEYRKTIVLNAFIKSVDLLTDRYSVNISQWAAENCLPRQRTEHTNFLLALEDDPVIYESTDRLVRPNRFSRERKLVRRNSQLRSCNRFELIRNGGRVISILPE